MEPIRFDTTQFIPRNIPAPAAAGSPFTEEAQKSSFGDMLKSHLAEVNHLQNSADTAVQKLASGQDKDIHNTMIAMEKAGVAFQLTMQVRNKVLEAYQEIMRMQV
jgi:flagellar hook-basal body complex protein FliE